MFHFQIQIDEVDDLEEMDDSANFVTSSNDHEGDGDVTNGCRHDVAWLLDSDDLLEEPSNRRTQVSSKLFHYC